MAQLFKIDMSGNSSPLQVYGAAGDLLFDANFSSMRSYGIFSVNVNINTNNAFPPSRYYPTFAASYLPFGKTFSRAPYFSPVVQKTNTSKWGAPLISYPHNDSSQMTGEFVTSTVNGLWCGNYTRTFGANFQVCVYENGAFA